LSLSLLNFTPLTFIKVLFIFKFQVFLILAFFVPFWNIDAPEYPSALWWYLCPHSEWTHTHSMSPNVTIENEDINATSSPSADSHTRAAKKNVCLLCKIPS
ncbi:unnamed protein product, partial [Meganyctiphanes norvegica]